MTYSLSFELPGLPKGLNGSHGHWSGAAAERKKWRTLSAFTSKSIFTKFASPLKECSLICTRFSSLEPDYDNLAASFKPIIDGLKDAGVIEDDRSSCVKQREYKWEKIAPRKGKIRIEVREL